MNTTSTGPNGELSLRTAESLCECTDYDVEIVGVHSSNLLKLTMALVYFFREWSKVFSRIGVMIRHWNSLQLVHFITISFRASVFHSNDAKLVLAFLGLLQPSVPLFLNRELGCVIVIES